MANIYELLVDSLPLPVYSLQLKKYLACQKFSIDDAVKAAIGACFQELDRPEFYRGIEALLDHHWSKSIKVAWDYVEK